MGFCSQFRALFKKNFIFWYRNICGSLCELLFPLVLMIIIVIVRKLVKDEAIPQKNYLNDCKYTYHFGGNPMTNTNWLDTCTGTKMFSSCMVYNRLKFGLVVPDAVLNAKLEAALIQATQGFKTLSYEFSVKSFNSAAEMEDYVTSSDYDEALPGLCAGIIIEGTQGNYNVKLRYDDNDRASNKDNKQQVPSTKNPVVNNLNPQPDEKSYAMYYMSGFTFLEYLITSIISGQPNVKIGMIPMQAAGYVEDNFLTGAGQFLSFFIVLCYLAPVFRIVSMIVQDKELKTREGMNMMGLKDSAYWLSFTIYYLIIFILIALIMSIVSVSLVFKKSNWFLTFLFFFLFGLSVYSFGFCLATFFQRSRVASITATMLYFATTLVANLVNDDNTNETSKNAASLLPTVAVSLGMSSYVNYEVSQTGVNFSNATEKFSNYRFSSSLILLTIDIFLYGIIGLYLDNVIPNSNGVRKPFYYFLTKSYWTGKHSTQQSANERSQAINANEDEIICPDEHFERIGEELKAQEENDECLKIRYLNKNFGPKQVVSDFSVNMYKGQIFALLGPNGAGKTTTISMLSGLLPVTSGTSSFDGISMFTEMSKLREKLGVCPQHDVLFEFLTPKEHLEIFAAFKGRNDTASIKKDVEDILQDIELKDSINTIASNLSGGQRRKLSIGIAFIGNSDMIFLDEPTSGIDIAARKRVWAMLKKYKQSKVIILTTHYMEEAEELGDRIGIMTSGKLRCVGAPLFLKTVYGAGYNLIVAYEDADKKEIIQGNITSFIKTFIQGVHIRKEAGKEITYFLPKDQSKNFKQFFTELDKNLENLKISSYGMATNTLEEIFLRVAREDETHGQKLKANMYSESIMKSNVNQTPDDAKLDTYTIMDEPEPSFCHSFAAHFGAILLKRIYINYRNIGTIITEILVPIILVIFGFTLSIIISVNNSDPRPFNVEIYSTPQLIMVNKIYGNNIDSNDFTKYFDSGLKALPVDATDISTMNEEIYQSGKRASQHYGSLYIDNLDNTGYNFVIFVNTSSQDSAGAFMGFFCQTLVRYITNDANYKLSFESAPFPLTYIAKNRKQAMSGQIISNILVIAFALVPASIISFIVQERETNLKHQQLISGVSLIAYWLANGAMDIFKALIPCAMAIAMVYAFGATLPYAWVFILIYGFSIIPFTYAMSFLFIKENVAQTSALLLNFFAGVVLSPVFVMLRLFESTRMIAKVLCWVFRFFPSFSLAYGINNISYKEVYAAIDGRKADSNFSITVAGGDLFFIVFAFPLYTILIWMTEARYFEFCSRCCEPKQAEERAKLAEKHELVIKEEKACDAALLDKDPPAILARHTKKIYRLSATSSTLAVDDISFGVNKGECLALLGTNGAGKTTTFKMITKDIIPSQGEIFINGMELGTNFTKIRKLIGYGPQYESGYMSLTVRENLEFYARLKGIPIGIREKLLQKLINEMDLNQYEHVQMGQLSGGNKRKTTAAIALLGNPPIVLLDELSTGVDPQAKRFMWHVIQRISTKNKNTAVILTTHSMEEAEYLSTKMAIMVAGSFCCIGTSQELKSAFGKGFEIQISIPLPNDKNEEEYLDRFGIAVSSMMTHDEIVKLFEKAGYSTLKEQLTSKGSAAHIMAELDSSKAVRAKLVANFLMIHDKAMQIAQELANEFEEVRVPEHIGNFFKFRIDKSKQEHTIGFLFGMLQGIVEKYSITQYSASQTSLNQIFQTFAKQAEYGLEVGKDMMVIKKAEGVKAHVGNNEVALCIPDQGHLLNQESHTSMHVSPK